MKNPTSIEEIKSVVPVITILQAYGSTPDSHGKLSCIFPERHTNSDVHHSVGIHNDVATCWAQKCFEQADVFEIVRLKEGIQSFVEQKKRVLELAGLNGQSHGQGLGKVVAEYNYSDEHGAILFQVVRYHPKTFRQRRPDGQGGWIWNLKDTSLVLYRLADVLKADHVLIVEGEKDVEAAYSLGLPDGWAATCNPMGAGKWREDYSTSLKGKRVVILPDADEPGRKHAEQIAQFLMGKAKQLDRLGLPEGVKDLSAWSPGKTGADLEALLENSDSCFPYSPGGSPESNSSNFHPVAAPDLLSQPPKAVSWVLDEYLPQGGLVLLAGKPKEGKTTLTYELVVKLVKGQSFLGRETHKGAVLILAVEEREQDVQMRLHTLGADTLDELYIHVGPSELNATVLARITHFVQAHHITLIVIDTLAAFWRVQNENDASEVTQAVKPLLRLARESGACVLLIHHARKSEGQYGDEIRGSGALFAAVDVALILKRHEVQTQRLLQAQSRYPETPSELVLELRETGYVALGDPAATGKTARLAKLAGILTEQWETTEVLAQRAGLSRRDTSTLLQFLVKEGKAVQDGNGVKGSPFAFRKYSFLATPPVIGEDTNTNSPQATQFDSGDPPPPPQNGNENATAATEIVYVD